MKGMYDSFNSGKRITTTTISDTVHCRALVVLPDALVVLPDALWILMSKSTQPHPSTMTKQKLWSYSSSMQLIHQPNSVAMTISIPCLLEMITTLQAPTGSEGWPGLLSSAENQSSTYHRY